MIAQQKQDLIYNALLVGMDIKSALLYAGLTESEITECLSNDEMMSKWRGLGKSFEYGLLDKLNTIAEKQMNMGREGAVTWLLERVNPDRWSTKATTDELPEIHLHLGDKTQSIEEMAEVHK